MKTKNIHLTKQNQEVQKVATKEKDVE